MEEKLKKFYQAYKAWLDEGAQEHKHFIRSCGLCTNLRYWAKTKYGSEIADDLIRYMQFQFIEAKMHLFMPFSQYSEYVDEKAKCSMHLNPMRIAWVNEHAQ